MSEVTFEPFQKVLVRMGDNTWIADFYSHYNRKNCFVTTAGRVSDYENILPYNEETKHLLGTTDSPTPPEREYKWGDHVEVRDDEHQEWIRAIFCYKKPIGYYCVVHPINYNHWKYCRHANW